MNDPELKVEQNTDQTLIDMREDLYHTVLPTEITQKAIQIQTDNSNNAELELNLILEAEKVERQELPSENQNKKSNKQD